MKREILITSDGSSTIHLPDWNEQYHSKNGSINETYHVFINSGLKLVSSDKVSILEIGFGTGLNCFITYLEGKKEIHYVGVEAYPVTSEEVHKMNFISPYTELPKKLTVMQNLIVYGKLYSVKNIKDRIEYLSEKLRLKEFPNLILTKLN